MDHSPYLRVLLSVWVGLGLGQLVQALHRLARFKGKVIWDWLPVTWALFAFLMYIQTWWAYFTLLQSPLWLNLLAFLLPLTAFVVLYLICASALPDVAQTQATSTVNLRTFYVAQHRYFFALWSILMAVAITVSTLVRGGMQVLGMDGFRIAALAAAVTLAWTPNRRVHVIVTLLSATALLLFIMRYTRLQ